MSIETHVFRALADPTRRIIYECLTKREMNVSQVGEELTVSQPAISQHIGILRDAGLLRDRRQGRFTFYRADPSGLAPMLSWIERYRQFWPERVQELEKKLKEIDR